MKQILIRQGDVLVIARPHLSGAIPNAKPVAPDAAHKGKVILAYGEVTGHCHAIASDTASLVETEDGRRFLQLVEPALLTHDEHDTLVIPEGTHEVIIQSEYRPEAIRNVRD